MSEILVVEDDSDLRFLYDAMLSRSGYGVTLASSTSEAILRLTNAQFDLIILDINMPDLSGIRLIEFMCGDVRLQRIPVLVISANETARDSVYRLGVEHFLVKPVTMAELVKMAGRLLPA